MSYKKNNNRSIKKKAYLDKKCFNCHKLKHYDWDCSYSNGQNPKIYHYRDSNWERNEKSRGQGPSKSDSQPYQNRALQAVSNNNNNKKSGLEHFLSGLVVIVFIIAKKPQQLRKAENRSNTWFFNLCALCYLCNNRKLFSNIKAKSIDFITIVGQVI